MRDKYNSHTLCAILKSRSAWLIFVTILRPTTVNYKQIVAHEREVHMQVDVNNV